MSELRDRLERLAARGHGRGADDVLDAAHARHAREASARRPTSTATISPIRRRSSRSSRPSPTRTAAAGSARWSPRSASPRCVGVGVLAITAMFGSGGASSPEGAVRQLADAITHKDPLAAVDVLVALRGALDARDREGRHEAAPPTCKIVDDASQPLAGVDLSVDHLAALHRRRSPTVTPRSRSRAASSRRDARGRDVEAAAGRAARTRSPRTARARPISPGSRRAPTCRRSS